MPTVIVPVGLNLGPSYRYVTPPDPNPEYYRVKPGWRPASSVGGHSINLNHCGSGRSSTRPSCTAWRVGPRSWRISSTLW